MRLRYSAFYCKPRFQYEQESQMLIYALSGRAAGSMWTTVCIWIYENVTVSSRSRAIFDLPNFGCISVDCLLVLRAATSSGLFVIQAGISRRHISSSLGALTRSWRTSQDRYHRSKSPPGAPQEENQISRPPFATSLALNVLQSGYLEAFHRSTPPFAGVLTIR
jgi:hypothetical protein